MPQLDGRRKKNLEKGISNRHRTSSTMNGMIPSILRSVEVSIEGSEKCCRVHDFVYV